MDIMQLLTKPESKILEFKRDLSSPKGVLRAMVAFANTAGGIIILGVEDKTHHICGIADPFAVEEKLANLIDTCIEPQLLPEIEIFPWRDTYLVGVQIFPSSVRPHYVKKQGIEEGTYIRIGASNRLADSIMLSELRRIRIDDAFDKQPLLSLSSEDLDFRVAAELFSERHLLTSYDLETLDLVSIHQNRKVPTAGGVILFGKNRLKYFPDAWIQVGRFAGQNKINIIDTQEITSYPVIAIDEAINFIKKHAMRGIEIPGGVSYSRSGSKRLTSPLSASRHTETWSVPLMAIREAIINAVVHADYAQQGSPIRVAVFDDRIEIENPGLLLFGLTIEEIKRGISKLRNRVIGQVFYRLGLIERWGSGIRRIISLCVEAGFAEPLFEELGTHFRVTLFIEKVAENAITLDFRKIDALDQTIIDILQRANGLSTKEISVLINRSERTVRTRLIKLIEKGLVVEISKNLNDPKRKYYAV